jgi:hypothetical protein
MLRRYGGNAGGCAPPHPRELARKGNTPRVAVADDVKACVKGVRRGDQATEPRTAYCTFYVKLCWYVRDACWRVLAKSGILGAVGVKLGVN